jgi:hypothetical protein
LCERRQHAYTRTRYPDSFKCCTRAPQRARLMLFFPVGTHTQLAVSLLRHHSRARIVASFSHVCLALRLFALQHPSL